jgi:hypothetical protein
MEDLINCQAMELLCRQRAIADPEHSWKWLARAERWENLGQRRSISSFNPSISGQTELGPMPMGTNTIDGDQYVEKFASG